MMELAPKTFGPFRLVGLRQIGNYMDMEQTWERFYEILEKGIIPMGVKTRWMSVYHDDPTKVHEDELRSDACATVPPGWEPPAGHGLHVFELPEHEYLTYRHKGPYTAIPELWGKMVLEAVPQSGRSIAAAPGIEMYLNLPQRTPPEELLTDLCCPVE